MNKILNLIDQLREGSIDVFTVLRAIDVLFISDEINSEEYMDLMDMVKV